MKTRTFIIWTMTALTVLAPVTGAYAQRAGGIDSGGILRHYIISNGPEGPIHGGESAISGMLLMADRITGKEAERIGLVYKAVPEESLDSTVEGIVQRLSAAATKSIAVIKNQMANQLDMDYRQATNHSISIRASYTLEDTQEGITAFLEKRPAKFTGR